MNVCKWWKSLRNGIWEYFISYIYTFCMMERNYRRRILYWHLTQYKVFKKDFLKLQKASDKSLENYWMTMCLTCFWGYWCISQESCSRSSLESFQFWVAVILRDGRDFKPAVLKKKDLTYPWKSNYH